MSSPLPSLSELSAAVQAGSLSPVDLVERCLKAIADRDQELQAWAYVAVDEARAAARALADELAKSGPRGPLHGIPFGVKDIFDTAGVPTEWGSALYAGRVPETDSELVAELKAAGAIVLGKTHTTAFAYFDPGPTRNPHNSGHTPGGSSSGSAAAVAAGMVPFALGSQTMGSVLRPASFCGIVGWKPSFGRLPLAGVLPFAPSLDHPGLFTRTVGDLRFLWEAMGRAGVEPPSRPMRLAVPRWPLAGELEHAMAAGFNDALERLRQAGFVVETVQAPPSFQRLPEATLTVLAREAADVHGEQFESHGAKIGAKLAQLIERGLGITEEQEEQARVEIAAARRDFNHWSEGWDATATPAALGPAPRGLDSTGDPSANAPWTALGVPAVALPFGDDHGLPLGFQLSAPAEREVELLAVAAACENVFTGR